MEDTDGDGIIIRYAEYNRDHVYRLQKDLVHYYTGVLHVDMDLGIETYLMGLNITIV